MKTSESARNFIREENLSFSDRYHRFWIDKTGSYFEIHFGMFTYISNQTLDFIQKWPNWPDDMGSC